MKVWISKYALTQGIFEMEAEQDKTYPSMVTRIGNNLETYHEEGRDWHLTKESAIKKAEEMRLKKIESVKKQLAKLEKLKFE